MAEKTKGDPLTHTSSNLKEVSYVPIKSGEFKPLEGSTKSDTFYLYFIVSTALLPTLTGATSFAWTSPVIPKLQSTDSSINPLDQPITTLEISLMAALPCLTGPVGALLSAPLSDTLGRKKCLQIIAVGMLLFNGIIAFSNRAMYIIIARCFFFMFYFGALTITPIFITEVCEDHNRAKFGCLMGLVAPVGTLYSFVFGPPFSVRYFTLITVVPLVLFLVLFLSTYETPLFSLSIGNEQDCKKALKKLRSNKNEEDLERDFLIINKTLQDKQNVKSIGIISIVKTRESRIGVLIAFLPFALAHGSGGPILMQFLGPVFNEADSYLSGDNIAIIVATVKCFLFLCTSFIVERTGRKPLSFFSSVCCSIPLIILGWFFYLKHNNSSLIYELKWLPLLSFMIFIISFSIGIGPVAPSVSGEMFTTDVRAAASSIVTTLVGLLVFVLSFTFPFIAEGLGYHWCFWLFASICIFGATIIYVMLPETRGKSLNEIQNILRNYKLDWRRKM